MRLIYRCDDILSIGLSRLNIVLNMFIYIALQGITNISNKRIIS